MTVYTITGTDADEEIGPNSVSPTVTSDGAPDNAPTNTRDIIKAKGGNDNVSAGDGDDDVFLGGGNDTFWWDAIIDAGSDHVDGGSGVDTVNFKGFGEDIEIRSAAGGHAEIASDATTLDLFKVEKIRIGAFGASNGDVTVRDLSGTHVEKVTIDFATAYNDASPDGDGDNAEVDGSSGADDIEIVHSGASVKVKGLAADVTVKHLDADKDSLTVKGYGGSDTIDASALPANLVGLNLDGGDGGDTVIGSQGNDTLFGGRGKDVIKGGKGSDVIFGDDFYAAGASADTLKGGGGADDFWLKAVPNSSKADTILDFKVGIDTLTLMGDAFHDMLGDSLSAQEFHIGKNAHDADDRIIYNDKTGGLFYDVDGKGGEGKVLFAILDDHLNLSENDFVLPFA